MSSTATSRTVIDFIDPSERVKRFGIECVGPFGDGITFFAGQWRPGGEYVQKLLVRNVTTSVKKFKYKLPSTRYFSMSFPEIITLSPGMSQEIDVIFRPVEVESYDDAIYIKMHEGLGSEGFYVPVRALIVKLQISAPFGVDLGYCATHQISSQIFQLNNIGEIDAPFYWQAPHPFILEPMSGIIPVGQKCEVKVSINPQDASVYVSQAVCIVGDKVHANIPEPVITTKFSAIGKYTYIVLSDALVDFGEVLAGTPVDQQKKEIVLFNNGVVPAEFRCIRVDNDREEVFEVYPKEGVIPARSEISITLKFHALAMGCYSFEQYIFKTPSNCKTVLSLKGQVMSPSITLHKESQFSTLHTTAVTNKIKTPDNSINFNDVEVDNSQVRILYLKNNSELESYYSVLAHEEGTFSVVPSHGTIPAGMEFPLKLTFTPAKPINYYRRIFISIGDSLPQFFDAYGSGYIRARGEIKEQRPLPIRHAHIQAYRNRSVQGLGHLSPDELDEMIESQGMSSLFAGLGANGTLAYSITSLKNPMSRTGEATRTDLAVAHEFFIDETDISSREVTIDKKELDFGYTAYGSTSDSKTVTITNHTNGKMSIVWYSAPVKTIGRGGAPSGNGRLETGDVAFSVLPSSSDINAGSSQSFKVSFRPAQTGRNYTSELEAYVFFKNQRTFRLVNDNTLTPPWFLPVRVAGHTFTTGQLLAKTSIQGGAVRSGKLVFPTCYVGDSLFQCIRLRNSGNLPATFNILLGWDEDAPRPSAARDSESIFTVKPLSGEIAAESFTLIYIRFTPNTSKKYLQLLRCIVNGSLGGSLLVEGLAGLPSLKFPELSTTSAVAVTTSNLTSNPNSSLPVSGFQGSLYLKPTYVGLSSSISFPLKNSSRLPLRFKISLPPTADGILSIYPLTGLLRGNEQTSVTISFAPRKQQTYNFRVHVKVFPIGGSPPKVTDARQPGLTEPIIILQTLSFNIIALGEVNAILFDPSRASTGIHLVNTTEELHLHIENVSDSDVCYNLQYKMEFTSESSSLNYNHFITNAQPILNSTLVKGGKDANHHILCDAPTGLLPARSKTKIGFVFTPNQAGLFEFIIIGFIDAADNNGNPIRIANEEAALLRLNRADISTFTEDDLREKEDQLVTLPLIANITGRASFPTLTVKDIRAEGDLLVSDVEQLWRQFSLTSLNYELSLPLTDAEVHFNNLSSPNLSSLKRFSLDFTPDVLGAPKQVIVLLLHNNGFLPSTFRLHLPNEKELELEPWCDEDELSEERLMQVSIIEELRCFEIEPRIGTLAPGECIPITFSYTHSSVRYTGLHKLPVLVKIHQGKQFWFDVTGRTLALPNLAAFPDEQPPQVSSITAVTSVLNNPPAALLLHPCTGADKSFTLSPVPIGLPFNETPMQRTELVNVSGVEATYQVELNSLKQLSTENFGIEILRIGNPKGTIPPRSSVFLEWYFYPLESKSYDISVVVRYTKAGMIIPEKHNKSSRARHLLTSTEFLQLTVKASGFDPRIGVPSSKLTYAGSVPLSQQSIQLKGQIATLSLDILNFGIIPQNCRSYQLVVLRNTSTSNTAIDFAIEENNSLLAEKGLLHIYPNNGVIPPDDHVILHVAISADSLPLFFRDKVKIVAREIIKGSKANLTSIRQAKLLDRIKRDRVGTASRENIIQHNTFSRGQSMDQAPLPTGRLGSLPSSTSLPGIPPSRKGVPDYLGGSHDHYSSSVDFAENTKGGGGSGGGNNTSNKRLPGTGGGAGGIGMTKDRSNNDVASISSRGGSSRSRKGPGEETATPQFGLPTVFILRLVGEIYSNGVCQQLLTKGPLKELLSGYINPVTQKFFPATSGAGRASSRGMVSPQCRQQEMRDILQISLSEIFKGVLSESTMINHVTEVVQTVANGLTLPESGALIPIGRPIYPLYYQELMPIIPLAKRLVMELRLLGIDDRYHETSNSHALVNSLSLDALDRDLAPSPWTRSSELLLMGASIFKVDREELREGILKMNISVKGIAYYTINKKLMSSYDNSISLAELIASLPTDVALIFQKKIMSYILDREFSAKLARRTIPTVLMEVELTQLSETEEKEPLAEDTSTVSLVNGIVNVPTKSDSSSRQLSARDKLLSSDVTRKSTDMQQEIVEADTVEAEVKSLVEESALTDSATKNNEDEDGTAADDNITDNEEGEEVDPEALLNLESLQQLAKEEEEKRKLKFQTAAILIQRVLARGRNAKKVAENKKKQIQDERIQKALCQPGFMELTADILANTMFNLMQEASYGEFSVMAEPIKFMLKK